MSVECLGQFSGIVPSVAFILTKPHGICSGKHLLKTSGNAILVLKFPNVPRCLGPQELVPLVQVPKPPTIHYEPAA